MTSRVQMIIDTLKAHPEQRFTSQQLARTLIQRYASEFVEKRKNPRFANETDFLKQIAAEIGGERTVRAKQQCAHIVTRDKPRPRLYYWSKTVDLPSEELTPGRIEVANGAEKIPTIEPALSEHALYPLLIDYLSQEEGLYCRRIDEKRSLNNKGAGGNHWLFPDIVALQALDEDWHDTVKTCVRTGHGQAARLWSFEVKKELNRSNVRQCFFQAVSNSSWANFGYLVATGISEDKHNGVERELQMLAALHGIGVILLNPDDTSNSQTLIPARENPLVDWQSANRLVEENTDFRDFIELTGMYHQTGKVRKTEWNK
jgi:hypothetical protein